MPPATLDPGAIRAVLAARPRGSTISVRDLFLELGLQRNQTRALREALRELVRDGAAIRLGRGRFAAAQPARLETGTLHVARGGYGFVHAEGSGDRVVVFVPRREMSGALHGDRVMARVTLAKPDGRLEGTVERILQRAHTVVLGVWDPEPDPRAATARVRPLDARLALGIRAKHHEALPSGTVVEVRIDRYPEVGMMADGTVMHVIGPVDDPRSDIAIACRKHGLSAEFPPDVEAELRSIPPEVLPAERAGREDFRADLVVTIDPDTAKDFDDAVHVVRRPSGGYQLSVHIADVGAYVREGSALDREAARRGTSVYFPGVVIPMLPHPLSSGICSLRPLEERLVVSAIMEIDAEGRLGTARFARGLIQSAARLTYVEAQAIMDGDAAACARWPRLVEPLGLAVELARLLRRRRQQNGSIDFDLPEPEIVWSTEGEMTGIVAADQSFSHKVIEEFMLLANQAVARRLTRPDAAAIHRVHERPDPARLEALNEDLAPLGLALDGDLDAPSPDMFQRLLARVAGRPEERIVSTLTLRAMMLARYDTEPLGHFGLAMKLYTHFTSPIRRYPDLVVHRLLLDAIGATATRERHLGPICRHSSDRERVAMEAEREVMDVKKCRFMLERLGEELDGLVLSLDKNGVWVELCDYLIDGFVPRETLTDDVYELVPSQRTLVGAIRGHRIRLGDRVRVRVERVDVERRSIDFAILVPGAPREGARPSRKSLVRQRRLRKRDAAPVPAPAPRRSRAPARTAARRRGRQGKKR